ncbi:MAG: iron-containing alcohol dehydrogenase [Chloroflexi bacterium]|jgi:alcohol dehydrogenase class IV|nr:iron-containing alcohol dehydrogenase [Chloroflexota bacterium]MBT7080108.1 iron-containing alcohol dehydrogenase [Chloroflexota bacterium]
MSLPNFFIKIPYSLVGPGSISKLPELIKEMDGTRVLIVTDNGVKEAGLLHTLIESIKNSGCHYSTYDECMPNTPSGNIDQCAKKAIEEQTDLLIGIGGGSVIDTTKIVSLLAANSLEMSDIIGAPTMPSKALAKIIIPTTSGTGSEWSRLALYTDEADGRKKMFRGMKVFADAVIIDPELTLGMPQRVTADTGIDALTHAIEAYTSSTAHTVGDSFSETAIQMVSCNLLRVYNNGKDLEARYNMSIAASLAMEAMTVEGGGLAHMIDASIIAKAHISHGAALAIILPHVMEYDIPANVDRYARLATLMGAKMSGLSLDEAAALSVQTFKKLCSDLGMKHKLSQVGIKSDDIPAMVENVLKFGGARLAPHKAEDITSILKAAL